ncbi:TRM11 family methyltransferase [Azohydromonas lata]|uniref:DNA adenine methylase n=1 Tax=Azohydromonas lata TaxID=45677 RepID=A0ABU5ICQ0_9BURK|nr:hypothetical protein [Azohydromonas lata]MDZ5456897.1 hypothetical protein [Azohydromonas lata]
MTDHTTAELLQRYSDITFYPAADDDCGWISAVLARFCPPGGRVLDPFCGSAVMSLVAALDGYEVFASDANPLTEVFVQMFKGRADYFKNIEITADALGRDDAQSIIGSICRSDMFGCDAASIHALLYCASRLLADGACIPAAAAHYQAMYRSVRARTASFVAGLEPHAHALERRLAYRTGDIARIDSGMGAHLCFFDPPYFNGCSFARSSAPLIALLGHRADPADDRALLADEAAYQRALTGWLKTCCDALDDAGVLVFAVSPGQREQRRQLLDAAHRLGLPLDEAVYGNQPYLYSVKAAAGKAP